MQSTIVLNPAVKKLFRKKVLVKTIKQFAQKYQWLEGKQG